MLDLLDFQEDKGGDIKKLKESQRRRFDKEEEIDKIVQAFEDYKKTNYQSTQIKAKINETQKEIAKILKAKGNASELLAAKVVLENQKKQNDDITALKQDLVQKQLKTIGNYVHDSVPISNTEDDNTVIRTWKPEEATVEKRDCLSHHEVLTRIDGYDPERGVKVAGHRGYFLTGPGVRLNRALIDYGLDFLQERGYKEVQPPYFMLKEAMAKTAQLEQFDEELYKVSEGDDNGKDDKYLIATSEQPLTAMHAGEWLQDADLPKKYAGISTNFRKEAGSHGKETWGLFRTHQFEKVEQVLITKPEDSWEAFDQMIAMAEEFYQSLHLPYQVVAIVSGALNNAAAKKYDLEAWFPYQGEYKELVSCSNCTDYQARAMETRYGAKSLTSSKKTYAHMLNSTLCATGRALCCVLENYQTEEGVRVPDVLRRYIRGQPEFIPYVRDLPKDSISNKTKANQEPVGNSSQTAKTMTVSAGEGLAAAQAQVADTVEKVTDKFRNMGK